MSLEQVVSDQNDLLEQQNGTIAELTRALQASTERLRRATSECAEQHVARVAAEAELSSRRFAHWATHVTAGIFIAWLLVCLVQGSK
jgi:hypothetical protein